MNEIVQEQSQTALEQLYQRYHLLLKGAVMRILHDEVEAQEVLQDVFLHVWTRGVAYCAEKGKVLGWLIVITRRRSLDLVRRRSAYHRGIERFKGTCEDSAPDVQSIHGAYREVCGHDLRQYFHTLIRRLPGHQRVAVELTFFQGLSQREIAASLNLPVGTVKTRIELGMRKLTAATRDIRAKVA